MSKSAKSAKPAAKKRKLEATVGSDQKAKTSAVAADTKEQPQPAPEPARKPTAFEEAGAGTVEAVMDKADETGQLRHKMGHRGLGMLISNFGGDGRCEVFVRCDKDGLIAEVTIKTPWAGEPTGKQAFAGEVGIDSGQFLITDPCYVLPHEK